MLDRIAGILLFLPVPLVLWLFLARPLGTLPSLAAGVLLMATHRLYARPFALSRSTRRCLWCGRPVGEGPILVLEEPAGTTTWRCCAAPHETALRRLLGRAHRWRLFLRAGILGSLLLFLALAVAADRGWAGPLTVDDAAALFRLGVALTVLPLGWLAVPLGPREAGRLRPPFPVHIQALIGTWAVLWLFRLVGLWWLLLGTAHLLRRAGGSLPAFLP